MGCSGSGYGQVAGCCVGGNDKRLLGDIVPVSISQQGANYPTKHNKQIWYNSLLLYNAKCFDCPDGPPSVLCRIQEKKYTRREASAVL